MSTYECPACRARVERLPAATTSAPPPFDWTCASCSTGYYRKDKQLGAIREGRKICVKCVLREIKDEPGIVTAAPSSPPSGTCPYFRDGAALGQHDEGCPYHAWITKALLACEPTPSTPAPPPKTPSPKGGEGYWICSECGEKVGGASGMIWAHDCPAKATGKSAATFPPSISPLDQTLRERHARYGDFEQEATLVENLWANLSIGSGWKNATNIQRHAMRMILVKIARIANGDCSYADNWFDIAGYAQLVERGLRGEEKQCQ